MSRHIGPPIKDPVTGGTMTRRRARGVIPWGIIYVVQRQDGRGPLKIGYTATLESLPARLAALQTGNPFRLHIVSHRGGTMEMEYLIHDVLAEHRLEGEWFADHPEVWAVLEDRAVWSSAPASRSSLPTTRAGQ